MQVVSFFSGVGGFELGLEIAELPFTISQFVEKEPHAQQVLMKNYPGVPICDDIRQFDPTGINGNNTIFTAGFPCTDISYSGKGAGIEEGTRSGLFFEVIRCIRLVRPRIVLLENVAALLDRGMGVVLAALSSVGYDAEWSIVSAASVGAVHLRERIFIIAYPQGGGWECKRGDNPQSGTNLTSECGSTETESAITHTSSTGLEGEEWSGVYCEEGQSEFANSVNQRAISQVEPNLCREDDGVSRRLDGHLLRRDGLQEALLFATDAEKKPFRKERLEELGNAIVPQVAAVVWHRVGRILGY